MKKKPLKQCTYFKAMASQKLNVLAAVLQILLVKMSSIPRATKTRTHLALRGQTPQ